MMLAPVVNVNVNVNVNQSTMPGRDCAHTLLYPSHPHVKVDKSKFVLGSDGSLKGTDYFVFTLHGPFG
jgi:hypothetical protein